MPNTDAQLATLGAMAQIAMDMHTDDGDTRDTIIENLTTIHMRDPEGAAQLLSVAIWLIAQNMCADDVEAEDDDSDVDRTDLDRYSLDIRYGFRDAFISLACDGREVASFSSGTPVAVIVDRIFKDMDPAEPEPEPVPPPLRGTISPDGQLEIAVPLDWQGEAKRAFYASVMRRNAEALLSARPELAGKMIDVTFDPEDGVLRGWKLSEDGKAAGDENPFVDAGSALPPLLKVAISPEGAVAIRVTSELLAASLEERARIGERILAAANRLLGERLDLQGRRLYLLWNSVSGVFESVAQFAPGTPMPSSPGWVGVESVGAEMTALSDLLETAEEALKTPQDELAARLDQIRTGEIRFPDSWKQPMPKLAEGGVIKSVKPYLAGEENVAPQKDSEELGDE